MTWQITRKRTLLNSGTLSPNPWDLSLWGQNVCSTLKALERRIGLRKDATPSAESRAEMARGSPKSRLPQNANLDPVEH